MSHAYPTVSESSSCSSSNFQLIINNALDEYRKRTKKDLLAHFLVSRLQTCDTPDAIIAVLQEQVQGLEQSSNSDERWSKLLDPTVNVLETFSSILEAGASLVCFTTYSCWSSHAHIYVTGIPTCESHLCRVRHPSFSEYP